MIKLRKDKREKLHREAIARWKVASECEEKQRILMNEDTLFAQSQDGQWADLVNGETEDSRARFTVNKIAASLAVVYGNYVHIRPQSKLVAAGLGADKESAEVRTGLVRSIEQQNQAADIYDTAFKNIIQCGFGAWKIKLDYSDDDSFDQDIIMIPIPDAANTVWFDPTAKRYDRRDGDYAFHVEHISFEDYKLRYPKSSMAQFPTMEKLVAGNTMNSYWYKGEMVAVGQYWRKVPVRKRIGLLETGKTVEVTAELEASLQNGEGAELVRDEMGNVKTRMVDSHRVEMFMMNGLEILGDGWEFPSKFIPIVPAFGEQVSVQGERHTRGMVRFAKDPQRIYNYANSAFIESAAISPEQPYLIASEQIDQYEEEWETAGAELPPYLRYRHIDGVPMPQRANAPMANQTLVAQMSQSENDIRATMGVINVGGMQQPQDISGRSFIEQIKNNDLGTVVFTDNLKKSVQYSTEIINSLLPVAYDSERVVRVVGEDGSTEEIAFNKQERNANGEWVTMNDLSSGKYDVFSSASPSYMSQRNELMETLNKLSANDPSFAAMTADFTASLIDAPFADKLQERVRKRLIQQGIDEPTEEEAEKFGINPQAMQQQQQATEQANQAFLQAQAQREQAETMKIQQQAASEAAKADKYVSENQSVMLDNVKKAIENVQLAMQSGMTPSPSDAMIIYGAKEIALDDIADSIEDRRELEANLQQTIGMMQAAQQQQQTQPIQPTPEQSVQIQQMQDLQGGY